MEWVVTTGRSLEEATEAALDELGVDEDELDIEILEEPRPGLFGRVRGEAKIRARVKPTTPRPKVDRRDRRRRNGGSGGSSGSSGSGGGQASGGGRSRKAAAPAAASPTGADDEAPVEPPAAQAADEPVAPEVEVTDEATEERSGGSSGGGTRRRRGGRGGKRSPSEDGSIGDQERPAEEGEAMSAVSVEEQVTVMQDFLEGLLDAFDLDGEVSVEEIDDETSELQIEGDDLGLLIGPKGQTLAAIQDLARTVAQRKLPGSHEGRVRVDVSGYRQRRRAALERFARQVADDVRESGSQKVLEPMNAADRKVVHDVINEIDGVTTTSEGEEPRRRVVVLPAD